MAVEKYGVKFHSNFWLLLPGFRAITLFGHVFCRMTKLEMIAYLDTIAGKRLANHESIHIVQAHTFKTIWLGFYIFYVGYWFRNLLVCPSKAYRNIPFEKEAYENQYDYEYLQKYPKTRWKYYRN